MIFAPHPDDESLPAGILLQRAVANGAQLRVVYASDGENNPWPQRVWAQRWTLKPAQQRAWREIRRQEALRALDTLGVKPTSAQFLALPDQGLTRLLLEHGEETARNLRRIIDQWQPTHVLAPSTADTHPDHSALAILLNFAGVPVPCDSRATWSYLVHGNRQKFASFATEITGRTDQKFRKRRAIECHKTQVTLSRRRLLGYASRVELFRPENLETRTTKAGSLRLLALQDDALRLSVLPPRYSMRARTRALHVLAHDRASGLIRVELLVSPQRGIRDDFRAGIVFNQRQHDDATPYEIAIATDRFDLSQPIFAKLAGSSFGIYDDGWLEVRAGDTQLEHTGKTAAADAMLACNSRITRLSPAG